LADVLLFFAVALAMFVSRGMGTCVEKMPADAKGYRRRTIPLTY
jgi:hypothetical protein